MNPSHSTIDPATSLGDVPELIDTFDFTPPQLPLPPADQAKKAKIQDAVERRDLADLIDLAISAGGLIDDSLRRAAWPILLGVTSTSVDKDESQSDGHPSVTHHDEEQVQKDVDRSFVHYPSSITSEQLAHRRAQLSELILIVLNRHKELCYFQGYHDIVQVLLLVLNSGKGLTIEAVERLSLLRIRDFMLPTMTAAMSHLNLIPAILFAADQELYRHTISTKPFFALSATLTLYAHNIDAYSDIARLFDFLLASDATTPLYFFVATILDRRKELLEIDAVCDPDILQFTMQKLPNPLDLEGLIHRTLSLQKQHPPETLAFGAWGKVSRYSVLKTTRNPDGLQSSTLEDGEELFRKHAVQVHRQEMIMAGVRKVQQFLRTNRRPILMLTITTAVTFLAYILRDNAGLRGPNPLFGNYLRPLWQRLDRRNFLGL